MNNQTHYEPCIGLEVHAQVHSASKMFCGCPVLADTGDLPPNSAVCPVCAGLPGALPVANRRAVEQAVRVALALHAGLAPLTRFARKSYFYPDLPKGYQISQYDLPLATGGWLEIEGDEGPRRIAIDNVHLEEDSGKLDHAGSLTRVDLNRAGVPLIEIVTRPDLRSAAEARAFAVALRQLLVYLEINSGDMEKGVMRFEASVSVRRAGTDVLNPRHEIKNLNSFRALQRAVEYEIAQQTAQLERGEPLAPQTMGWDENRQATVVQRAKETAADYRYFPEPDLPPLELDPAWIEQLRATLPERPAARRARLIDTYGLEVDRARLLTEQRAVADYYEAVVAAARADARTVAHWVSGEIFRLLKERGESIEQLPVSAAALAELIDLLEDGTVNRGSAQAVLVEMAASGCRAAQIVDERSLAQISDPAALRRVVEQVLADHPQQAAQALAGQDKLFEWLIGQVMRATRGRADPQAVRAMLAQALATWPVPGSDVPPGGWLEVAVGELLRARGLTLSTAESCSGGLVGHCLTNVPGSSDYYLGGIIAYANSAKQQLLDVPQATLETHSAVSAETALAMARGVRRRLHSDLGVAVTGIAGPGGGTAEKPVGLVYVGLAAPDGEWVEAHHESGDRQSNKAASAEAALEMVKRYLSAKAPTVKQ